MSTCWQKQLKHNIHTVDDLILSGIDILDKDNIQTIVDRHPMNIPKYYYNLINKEDPEDPIRKMSIPNVMELINDGDYDTSGEQENTVLPGLQHKYNNTALVLSTNQCYMYCRHCFRKRMVGFTQDEIMRTMNKAVEYITEHEEINNVLISGGDSFTLSNKTIRDYLLNLTAIDHIDFIRFGTRVPVVFPQRISEDSELLSILNEFSKKKKIYVVTQFNHPKEISNQSIEAIKSLKENGIDILNQTVLLKGVNNHPQTLAKLLKTLCKVGINPYYVFQCRPVKYVKNSFQTGLIEGLEIINEVKNNLSGLSKRFRYVMSHPKGKIEIVGKIGDEMIFRFHQAKDHDDINQLFTKKITNEHNWLDTNLEPVG